MKNGALTAKTAEDLIGDNCVTVKSDEVSLLMYTLIDCADAYIPNKRGDSYIYKVGSHFICVSEHLVIGKRAKYTQVFHNRLLQELKALKELYTEEYDFYALEQIAIIEKILSAWVTEEFNCQLIK